MALPGSDFSQPWSYGKLLAKFDAYYKATKRSKYEVVIDTDKLGYLDYKNRAIPCHPIKDEDVEMFCPDMTPTQSVQINTMDMEATKKQVADETVAKEDDAKEGAIDEVVAYFPEQVVEAAEQMDAFDEQLAELGGVMDDAVDQVEAEETGPPATSVTSSTTTWLGSTAVSGTPILDPKVQTYRTWITPNMRNPIDSKTVTKLKSEHTVVLGTMWRSF
ncbi:unnamed protein product [Prunus armeniaca]